MTGAADLIRKIEQATAGCDSEADALRAVLGLEGDLTEDERAVCEVIGLRTLAAVHERGKDDDLKRAH
jgi:hypothetical protein